jgi:hypothetical protein
MLLPNYNKKLGYYRLGDEEFEFKSQALIAAAKAAAHMPPGSLPHPKFVFNNDLFDWIKWKHEPSESLNQLYLQRVQQIREKYDYVILSYSGGSDSWNILNTFLKNNIRLDEIIVSVPIEATKNVPHDAENFSYYNYWMEYYEVTVKDLQILAVTHPHIKITVNDWSVNADKFQLDPDWITRRSNFCGLQVNNRISLEYITKSSHKFKNIGYVFGIDKPRVCYKDDKYYIYFLDFYMQTVFMHDHSVNDLWNVELFYWAPESEALMRKQAHIVKRFFQQHPMFLPYIGWGNNTPAFRQFYESLIRGLLYPEYDLTRWTPSKPLKLFQSTGYDSAIKDMAPHLVKQWQDDVQQLSQLIDPQFITKNHELVGFVSDFYEI